MLSNVSYLCMQKLGAKWWIKSALYRKSGVKFVLTKDF